MKNSLNMRRFVSSLFFCCAVLLFAGTPVFAQNAPVGVPFFEIQKWICPGSVEPQSGTTIPANCIQPSDPNAPNVPVVAPGSSIAFLYRVNYTCQGAQDCPSKDPQTVANTITDNQIPGSHPNVYGPLNDVNGNGMFDPGDVWLFVFNNKIVLDLSTQTPPGPAPVTGCATAVGGPRPTYINTSSITDGNTSNATYYCNPLAQPSPSISIVKFTNSQDADSPPGPEIQQGGRVEWTYVVTNDGNVALTGVQVTDNRGVVVTCPKDTLAPGESMTCTASGVAALGQYANIGTVIGTPPSGPNVSDTNPSHYFGTTKPAPKPVPIPEPVTVILFGTGLAALSATLATRRKKDK